MNSMTIKATSIPTRWSTRIGIALPFFRQQAGGADQEADAAERPQHDRQIPPRIRRLRAPRK